MLARDRDERVRILLARKLAALVPGLSAAEQAQLHQETWDTLKALVADEAVRVRAAIAEAVKELPDAPRGLIRQLAHDTEQIGVRAGDPAVAAADHGGSAGLGGQAPAPGTVLAVARRAELEPAVSDAIAATRRRPGDPRPAGQPVGADPRGDARRAGGAVGASTRTGTSRWCGGRRCRRAPRVMLSEIVATHLLAELATRADLAPPLAEELRRRIAVRLAARMHRSRRRRRSDTTAEEALAQARAMAARGELVEETLLAAARRGEARYAAALLAVAAGTPVSVVDRASSLRSAKGLVSLVWKAGFTMRVAVALQSLLARLAPEAVLIAGQSGGFPLAVEEMRWQLDFLGRMGR